MKTQRSILFLLTSLAALALSSSCSRSNEGGGKTGDGDGDTGDGDGDTGDGDGDTGDGDGDTGDGDGDTGDGDGDMGDGDGDTGDGDGDMGDGDSDGPGDGDGDEPGLGGMGPGGAGGMGGGGPVGESRSLTAYAITQGTVWQNAWVMIADAAGEWVATVRTDAKGEARIDDFPEGGSVTLGYDDGRHVHISTIVPHEEQNHIYGWDPSPSPASGSLATLQVTIENGPPSADSYSWISSRDLKSVDAISPSLEFTGDIGRTDLNTEGQYDLLVMAEAVGEPVGFSWILGNDITPSEFPLEATVDEFQTDLSTMTLRAGGDSSQGMTLILEPSRKGVSYGQAIKRGPANATPTTSVTVHDWFHDAAYMRLFLSHPTQGLLTINSAMTHLWGRLPAPGETGELTIPESDFFAAPSGVEVTEDGSLLLGYDSPPVCDGAVAQEIHYTVLFYGENSEHITWDLRAPYAPSITPPALDPEFVSALWLPEVTGRSFRAEVLTVVEGADAEARDPSAWKDSESWVRRQQPSAHVCHVFVTDIAS